jgi:hypothetical protein
MPTPRRWRITTLDDGPKQFDRFGRPPCVDHRVYFMGCHPDAGAIGAAPPSSDVLAVGAKRRSGTCGAIMGGRDFAEDDQVLSRYED